MNPPDQPSVKLPDMDGGKESGWEKGEIFVHVQVHVHEYFNAAPD